MVPQRQVMARRQRVAWRHQAVWHGLPSAVRRIVLLARRVHRHRPRGNRAPREGRRKPMPGVVRMPARAWRHRGRGAMPPWMRAPVPARWPPPWWPVAATAQGHRDRRPCRGRRLPPRARQVHASPQAVNRPPAPRPTTTGLDRPGRISISTPRPTAGRRHPAALGLMPLQRRPRQPMRPPRTRLSRMNPPRPPYPRRPCRSPHRVRLLRSRPYRCRLQPGLPPRRHPPRHMPLQQHMPLR